MDSFETFPEQPEAKRLLRASLADGHTHAYLFHGPRGVGKRAAALAFAGEVIGEPDRVLRHAHPDVYELEPVGDQIRIDDVRTLHRDLHMRPFEAQRRVYILQSADTMNEDAADALLKDLEEPPPYAVIVLVADELGPLPETIRSRCQHVPFRRLSRARGARGDRVARPRARAVEGRPRSRGSPAAGSTASSACSTPRRRVGATRCSSSRATSIATRRSSPQRPRPGSSRPPPSAAPRRAPRRRADLSAST